MEPRPNRLLDQMAYDLAGAGEVRTRHRVMAVALAFGLVLASIPIVVRDWILGEL